jgi:hypothetical protein
VLAALSLGLIYALVTLATPTFLAQCPFKNSCNYVFVLPGVVIEVPLSGLAVPGVGRVVTAVEGPGVVGHGVTAVGGPTRAVATTPRFITT